MGPDLYNSIIGVIWKFRIARSAFSGDVKERLTYDMKIYMHIDSCGEKVKMKIPATMIREK